MNTENNCYYVSSRGILNSCTIKSLTPVSSIHCLHNYNTQTINNGDIMYICSSAIFFFLTVVLKKLEEASIQIIIVSGDADVTVPDDIFQQGTNAFVQFLESKSIIHWYSQNCGFEHPKMTSIPIGLDYHTLSVNDYWWGKQISPEMQEQEIIQIRKNAKPWGERQCKIYSNFHFVAYPNRFDNDRNKAKTEIPEHLIFYEPNKITRNETWKNQIEYAFIACPHGNGMDTHRLWEALALGCIPIVRKSRIDVLYIGLPVLIVNEWKDITKTLLIDTVSRFSQMQFDYDKLTLKYWMDKINSSKLS